MSVMAFGNEVAQSVQNIKAGCVVMVINPKLMKEQQSGGNGQGNSQKGIMFAIDSEAQVEIIGYSEDYNICNGRTNQQQFLTGVGSESYACRTFLNKSVETICDKHKAEKKLMNIKRAQANRQNMQGDRVDINGIQRMQRLQNREFGAFGGKKQLNRLDNKPMPVNAQETFAK